MLNFQLRMYDKSLKVRLKKGTKNEERPFNIILVNNFKHDMKMIVEFHYIYMMYI